MAGGGGYLDMNGAPGTAAESEAEDARREAEEADCVFSAEDLERCAGAREAGEAWCASAVTACISTLNPLLLTLDCSQPMKSGWGLLLLHVARSLWGRCISMVQCGRMQGLWDMHSSKLCSSVCKAKELKGPGVAGNARLTALQQLLSQSNLT